MLLSSFDKTIHTCKIVRIVLVDVYNTGVRLSHMKNALVGVLTILKHFRNAPLTKMNVPL